MKNNLIENDKIKLALTNRFKINRKSIQLLKPFNISIDNEYDKLTTSRKGKISKTIYNKNYNIKSNIFESNSKEIPLLKSDSESDKSILNKNILRKSKIMPLLSDKNDENETRKKIRIKLSLNYKKDMKKYRGRNYSNDTNLDSPFNTFSQSSNRIFFRNIDKYKQIFKSVSSRIRTNYNKNKLSSNSRKYTNNIYSPKNKNFMNKLQSPSKAKSTYRMKNQVFLTQSNGKKTFNMDDYNRTLTKEFNTQELINIENSKIKERLKALKVKVYDKIPLFNSTEKLNTFLGRQFNLDIRNLKKSFNKKFKIYTRSINKIKEIKHKNLFNNNNNVFGYKINLEKKHVKKNEYTDFESKKALKTFYKFKSQDKLEKKLELEKQLIELENKFAYIIEQEKLEKNIMGINYGEINQVIQKKFLYREIYELDREQKKRQFYDEQTNILYNTRNYQPNKVLRDILKQKTINKFKGITGVNFN